MTDDLIERLQGTPYKAATSMDGKPGIVADLEAMLAQRAEAAAALKAKDAEIEQAQGRANQSAAAFEKLMASYQSLRARLANAEAALRVFSDAAEDLDDRAVGAIWECPEALLIECDDLRKARAYFAALDATTETNDAD